MSSPVRVLVFGRSGPGVIEVAGPPPAQLRIYDEAAYARQQPPAVAWGGDLPVTAPAWQLRTFDRRTYRAAPDDPVAQAWAEWGQAGWAAWVTDVYGER